MCYHLEPAGVPYKQQDNFKKLPLHLASSLSLQLKSEATLRSDWLIDCGV